jgi:uncharacterized surface anchored protein
MKSVKSPRFFVVLVLTIALQITIFLCASALTSSGTAVNFPFFTKVTLVDLDTGQTLGNSSVTDVSKNANVSVTYDFSIPNDQTVSAGSTYSFTLPKQIALFSAISDQALSDSDGNLVATVNIALDGTGSMTFTNFAETHKDVGGTFTITGHFNADNIGNTEIEHIPFVVGGHTDPYYVNVYFKQPAATNAKSGSYDAASGITTWTITLNKNDTTIHNGSLTDVITPGHPASGGDQSQVYVADTFKVVASDGSTIYDRSLTRLRSSLLTEAPSTIAAPPRETRERSPTRQPRQATPPSRAHSTTHSHLPLKTPSP